MTIKKILASVLAITMVLASFGTVALAEETTITVAAGESIQSALDAITAAGDYVISLAEGTFADDITIIQSEGINITLKGNNTVFSGTMYIHGQARFEGAETLTIKDISFATDTAKDFISSNTTESDERYAHNVTVDGCTFTATGEAVGGTVALRFRQAYNIKVQNCDFTNLHSAMWATGGADGVAFDNVSISDCKNGISTGTCAEVTVTNSTISTNSDYGYGIRADGNGAYTLSVENCTIDADAPVLVRKATNSSYELSVEGSTLNGTNDDGYAVIVTKKDYDEDPENTLEGNNGDIKVSFDDITKYPAFSAHAAKNGNKLYSTVQEAIDDANEGDTVIIKEGTYAVPSLKAGITVEGEGNVVLEGCLTGTLKNLTLKNLYIKGPNAQRWAYAKGEYLTFENVTFHATSVYAIHYDGIASTVNFTYKDCTIIGWAAMGGSPASCKFEGCTIKDNGTYGLVRTYFDAEFKDCTFDVDGANTEDKYQDGLHAVDAVMKVDNCTNANGNIEDILNASGESYIFVDGEVVFAPEEKTVAACIGFDVYETLGEALNNLEDGDTLEIATGTYDAFEVLADNVTITGMTDDTVVTVGSTTDTAFIGVGGDNLTVEGIKFVVPEAVGGRQGWITSVVGFASSQYNYGGVEPDGWDVIDCDFVQEGNALGIAIFNVNDFEVTGCTFENFGTGIAVMSDGSAPETVNVSDNTFANVGEFFTGYWGAAANATSSVTIVNNKATDGSTTVINVYDYAKETLGATATAFTDVTVTDNDAKVILTNYDTDDYTSDIADNASVVYTYKSKALLDAVDYPEGKVYVDYGRDTEVAYLVVGGEVLAVPETIAVEFELCPEAEGEKIYNIKLTADDDRIINRLNSVDLTFLLTQVNGENDFEIIASNSEVAINAVDNNKARYEFHYNGKTDVTTDTATSITIGQVKFTGYGEFSFAVDASAATNAAHSTTIDDNIVDTFIPNGNAANGEGVLDVSDDTITGVAIAVPVRNLTISIDFPNAAADNAIAYQDMKVVISGGDLAEDIAIDLGDDAVETALDIFGKEDAKYAADMINGSYEINVSDALTLNSTYTVTVSGAGYRTARYSVTMTDNKTLSFWNNVKDEAKVIETGKTSSAVTKNFLAGDIVKDNKINIYDLSAVVAYFGTEGLCKDYKPEYAKYDLNRDGVIDSKDVAYVLVSWGE